MRFQDFAQAQGYARTDYELTRHAPPLPQHRAKTPAAAFGICQSPPP